MESENAILAFAALAQPTRLDVFRLLMEHEPDRIERLVSDPQTYEEFSRRAEISVQDYLCPLKWDRLLEDFLDPAARKDLRRYSLARHSYF